MLHLLPHPFIPDTTATRCLSCGCPFLPLIAVGLVCSGCTAELIERVIAERRRVAA